jgi:hypothetical protein
MGAGGLQKKQSYMQDEEGYPLINRALDNFMQKTTFVSPIREKTICR